MLTPNLHTSSYALLRKKQMLAASLKRSPQPVSILKKNSLGRALQLRKLSEAIEQEDIKIEHGKELNTINMDIGSIDKVPKLFTTVQSINLSKNHLKNLNGIQQFSKLQILNIQDNDIHDFEKLEAELSQLHSLEELHIEGNPAQRNTLNWKSRVILALPKLKLLNSSRVISDHRRLAGVRLKKEKDMWDLLLENHITLLACREILRSLQSGRGNSGYDKNAPFSIDIALSNSRRKIETSFDSQLYKKNLQKKFIERHGVQEEGWEEKAMAQKIVKIEGKISLIKSEIASYPDSAPLTVLSSRVYSTSRNYESKMSPGKKACNLTVRSGKKVTIAPSSLSKNKSFRQPNSGYTTPRGQSLQSTRVLTEEEAQLEKTNAILKAKLAQFQHQNSSNMEKAKIEISKLAKQVEEAEMENLKLAEQINLATKRAQELVLRRTTESANQSGEIEWLQEAKQVAQEFANRSLQQRLLYYLKNATSLTKREKIISHKRKFKLLTLGFHMLKQYTLQQKILKLWRENSNKKLLHIALLGLKKNYRLMAPVSAFMKNQSMKTLKKVLYGFQIYPTKMEQHKLQAQQSVEFNRLRLLNRSIKSMKNVMKKIYLPMLEENKLTQISIQYYANNLLTKSLNCWKQYYQSRLPSREKTHKALVHYITLLYAKGIRGLRTNYLMKLLKVQKVGYYILQKQKQLLFTGFIALKMQVRTKRKLKIMNFLAKKIQMRRYMIYWKRSYIRKVGKSHRVEALDRYYELRLQLLCNKNNIVYLIINNVNMIGIKIILELIIIFY